MFIFLFFLKFHLFLFRERGREGERERKKHQCVVASREPPSGDLAHNPSMCPDWELNWRPFGSQAGTQSTEPQQPGLYICLLIFTEKLLCIKLFFLIAFSYFSIDVNAFMLIIFFFQLTLVYIYSL